MEINSDKEEHGDTMEELYAYDPKISLNYFSIPPMLKSDSRARPSNPDTGVEYLCSYGKDLLRSREMANFGKMANVEWIRQQGNFWQIFFAGYFEYSVERESQRSVPADPTSRESRVLVDVPGVDLPSRLGFFSIDSALLTPFFLLSVGFRGNILGLGFVDVFNCGVFLNSLHEFPIYGWPSAILEPLTESHNGPNLVEVLNISSSLVESLHVVSDSLGIELLDGIYVDHMPPSSSAYGKTATEFFRQLVE
ncbi:hypothetical protein LWI28_004811 [Acer negundo]|uniref:Uncharacterized protein n=1 Tax=Acer negundo TaxID=4023 RepID=A0AAD5ICY8_ACENE|nr:hypothetical protein LWI28_004811 [Acer negundo]